MAWTFVNAAEVTSSTNSQTVAKPTGVAVNDALVYVTRSNTGNPAVSTGGWFTEVSLISTGTTRVQTWFRVVDGSEPSTFGFTTTGTATSFFITGVAVRPPASFPVVDVFSTANNASSTQPCAPSITPTTDDDCLIWSTYLIGTGGTYTPPTGFTTPAAADITATHRLIMAYDLNQGATATGDIVATLTSGVINYTGMVALRMNAPPIPATANLGVATATSAAAQITTTTGSRAALGVATASSTAPQGTAAGVVIVHATASLNAASASSAAPQTTATGVVIVHASANLGVATASSAARQITTTTASLVGLAVASAGASAPVPIVTTGTTAPLGLASASTAASPITVTGVSALPATANLGAATASTSARAITAPAGALVDLGVAVALTAAPVISATGGTAAGVVASLGVASASTSARAITAQGTAPTVIHRGTTTARVTSGTTLTLDVPPSVVNGDVLVVLVSGLASGGSPHWTAPPGFSLFDETTRTNRHNAVYLKNAASEGATLTWTLSQPIAPDATGVLIALGAPSGYAVDYDDGSFTINSTDTEAPSASVQPTRPHDALVYGAFALPSPVHVTPPPDFVDLATSQRAGSAGAVAAFLNYDAGVDEFPSPIATVAPASVTEVVLFAFTLTPVPVVAALGTASAATAAREPTASAQTTALLTPAASTASARQITVTFLANVFTPRPAFVARLRRPTPRLSRERPVLTLHRRRRTIRLGAVRLTYHMVRTIVSRRIARWRIEPGGHPMAQLGGHFDFVQGDTIEELWQFFEEDGVTPVGGFAGADVFFTARDGGDAIVLTFDTADFISILDPANAVVQVVVPYTATDAIPIGNYEYDIQITEAGTAPRRVTTIEFGQMTVAKQYTRIVTP